MQQCRAKVGMLVLRECARPASGKCSSCGLPLCGRHKMESARGVLCPGCASREQAMNQQSAIKPPPGAARGQTQPGADRQPPLVDAVPVDPIERERRRRYYYRDDYLFYPGYYYYGPHYDAFDHSHTNYSDTGSGQPYPQDATDDDAYDPAES